MRANNKGFSLVELVIVVSLIGVVALMGAPSYQASIANSEIRTVAQSVKGGLQLARLEAIKRNTKIKFTVATDSAWKIGCNQVTADCPEVLQTKSAKENSANDVMLTLNGGTNVVFNSLGMLDSSGGNPLTRVDVNSMNTSIANDVRPLRVMINTGGNAKVCDPAVTTDGDTRKC